MDTEIWKRVPNHPEYEVSNLGRIRSWKTRGQAGPLPRILKPHIGKRHGYAVVHLSEDGVLSRRRVHQLVLEAFVGPRPDGWITRHLDGVRTNNHLDNLRWGTPAENAGDMLRHGTHPRNRMADECIHGHPFAGDNLYVDPNGKRHCRACMRDYDRRRRPSKGLAPGSWKAKKSGEYACGKHGREDGYEFDAKGGKFGTPYRTWICRICRREGKARCMRRKAEREAAARAA